MERTWLALLVTVLLGPLASAGAGCLDPALPGGSDLPPALDIRAAWFGFSGPSGPFTGVGEVDCLHQPCTDAFRVVVRLGDLGLAAPAAGGDADAAWHHYVVRFTPDAWGAQVEVRCVVALADLGPARLDAAGARPLAGTRCEEPSGAFAVAGVEVDRAADTVTATLAEAAFDLVPGVSFDGLHVATAASGIGTPPRPVDEWRACGAWTYDR